MIRRPDFRQLNYVLVFIALLTSIGYAQENPLVFPGEKHLRNVRQLTFGGQNAEAYFSLDDRYLIFQHQGKDVPCDQIYSIPVDTPDGKPAQPKLLSTGKGRTTCSYFSPLVTASCFPPRTLP